MKRYFVTGTDTHCGKTYTTVQLLNWYKDALAIKPIASGYAMEDISDAEQLAKSDILAISDINPWQFALPVSPHIAAHREGRSIHIKEVAEYCLNFDVPECDRLFIEGAGGVMVPLNNSETWLDFLKYTHIPVIFVVGLRLGCINHALLSYELFDKYQVPCVGWIANVIDPLMFAIEENIDTLSRLLPIPLLTTIPYQGTITYLEPLL